MRCVYRKSMVTRQNYSRGMHIRFRNFSFRRAAGCDCAVVLGFRKKGSGAVYSGSQQLAENRAGPADYYMGGHRRESDSGYDLSNLHNSRNNRISERLSFNAKRKNTAYAFNGSKQVSTTREARSTRLVAQYNIGT